MSPNDSRGKAWAFQGASDDEVKWFVTQCQRTGVDPLDRYFYLMKRKQWNSQAQSYDKKDGAAPK